MKEQAPVRRKNHIAICDASITAGRKVKGVSPLCEAKPAIATQSKRNDKSLQAAISVNDRHADSDGIRAANFSFRNPDAFDNQAFSPDTVRH
jgi:hypothetical protein